MILSDQTYERVQAYHDELFEYHFTDLKGHWVGTEERRLAFRKEWLKWLDEQDISEQDFDDTLCHRLDLLIKQGKI